MRGKTNVGGGTNTNAATATAADLLQGKTAFAKGNLLTGIIPTKAAETITPGVANKTIAAGLYLSGTQTIAGDVNLLAANIAAGKNIFGVNGSFNGTIKTASGTKASTYSGSNQTLNVTGLAFTPLCVYASSGTGYSAMYFYGIKMSYTTYSICANETQPVSGVTDLILSSSFTQAALGSFTFTISNASITGSSVNFSWNAWGI